MKKIISLSMFLLIASCGKNGIENYYKLFPGKVIITEIRDSKYNPDGKNGYADIFMDFIPDDPETQNKYRYKKWSDKHAQLSHKSNMNHNKAWIKKMNIHPGDEYKAIRYEKNSMGSSAPVIFKVFLDQKIK